MVLSTRGRCNDDAHRFPAWTKNFMHYFTCCKVEYILSISLQLKTGFICFGTTAGSSHWHAGIFVLLSGHIMATSHFFIKDFNFTAVAFSVF